MKRFLIPAMLAVALGVLALGQTPAQTPAQPAADASKDKALFEEVCSACHELELVTSQRASKEGWQSIVYDMLARGATVSDDNVARLINYLATTYPKATANAPRH